MCLVCCQGKHAFLRPVLRRPGAAAGARADGAGAAGERSGHLSPGRHALFSGLLPGQDSRY